jgi:hypothetical protein
MRYVHSVLRAAVIQVRSIQVHSDLCQVEEQNFCIFDAGEFY